MYNNVDTTVVLQCLYKSVRIQLYNGCKSLELLYNSVNSIVVPTLNCLTVVKQFIHNRCTSVHMYTCRHPFIILTVHTWHIRVLQFGTILYTDNSNRRTIVNNWRLIKITQWNRSGITRRIGKKYIF